MELLQIGKYRPPAALWGRCGILPAGVQYWWEMDEQGRYLRGLVEPVLPNAQYVDRINLVNWNGGRK